MRRSYRPPAAALLCALVLAPRTFPRNRFFDWYRHPAIARIRKRASVLRGILQQLARESGPRAEIVGEQVFQDGRVLLRYILPQLALTRSIALSPLEAALLRFGLARAQGRPIPPQDRGLIERSLAGLSPEWAFHDTPTPTSDLEPEGKS